MSCAGYRPSLDAILEQLPMIVHILQHVCCRRPSIQCALLFHCCVYGHRPAVVDRTYPALDCTTQSHTVLMPQADEALAQYILKAGVLPYFALSWYITWFAHEVQSLPQIARLFDLFMASHPLMPLYVGAAAMKVSVDRALGYAC
jgi:Rab-GTPase-TBC domain